MEHYIIPHGVVGNISACHADARGSIPRGEDFLDNNVVQTNFVNISYYIETAPLA